jgi:predicted DNA-binding transcriptional regulator YafY
MKKKNVSGNKTDRYIRLILEISNSPNWQITEEKLKELLGHPSKSQFYNYLQDLTSHNPERPAIIERIKHDETFIYKLHEETWKNFYEASLEGEFLLEAHKKIGYLLENDFTQLDFEFGSKTKDISRKFIYLSKVQAAPYSNETKEIIHNAIKAILGHTKIFLNYSEKFYTVFPLTLCQYRDELYLIGYKDEMKKENLRVFKMTRIEKLEQSKETFKYPSASKWNPFEVFKETSGLIQGIKRTAHIRVFGNSRRIIKEKSFFANKLISSAKDFDEYDCSYTNIQEFLGQVFVYADEMQILGPQELKDAFTQKATKALNLNQEVEEEVA